MSLTCDSTPFTFSNCLLNKNKKKPRPLYDCLDVLNVFQFIISKRNTFSPPLLHFVMVLLKCFNFFLLRRMKNVAITVWNTFNLTWVLEIGAVLKLKNTIFGTKTFFTKQLDFPCKTLKSTLTQNISKLKSKLMVFTYFGNRRAAC